MQLVTLLATVSQNNYESKFTIFISASVTLTSTAKIDVEHTVEEKANEKIRIYDSTNFNKDYEVRWNIFYKIMICCHY